VSKKQNRHQIKWWLIGMFGTMTVAAMASLSGLKAGEPMKGLNPADDAALAALTFIIPGTVIGLLAGGITAHRNDRQAPER